MREEIIDDRKEDSELRDLAKSMGAATGLSSSKNKTKKVSEKQEQKPKSPRIYQCPQENCKRGFKKKFIMKRHLKEVHSNIKPFCCEQSDCKKQFKSMDQLKAHIKYVHLKQKFSCTEKGCSKEYASNHSLRKHMKSHTPTGHLPSTSTHSQALPANSSPEKNTETLPENQEQKPKSPRIYPCPKEDCKGMFTKKFALNRHLKEKHSNIELFCCNYAGCEKRYKHERNLKSHIESSHANKRFFCTEKECSKKYPSNYNLQRHILQTHKNSPTGHPLDSSSSASSPMPSTSTHSQSTVSTSSKAKRKTSAAISEVNQHQDSQSPETHPFKRFHQDCSDIHSPSSPIIALSPSSPVSPLPPFTPSLNSSSLTDSSSTSYMPSTFTPELPIIKHLTLMDEASSLFDFENINTQIPQLPIVSPITDSSKLPESLSKKRKQPAHLARNNRYSNRYSIVNSFSQPNTRDTVIQMESLERSSKVSKLGKKS